MHLFGLLLDLLNPLLVFALARRVGASRGAALAAAGIFLTWPNHGETHWWTCSIMMNLFTTTLALAAFLAAGHTKWKRGPRLTLAALLYVVALFDYDQVFFLWIPLLAFAYWADSGLRRGRLAAAAAGFLALDAAHFAARMLSPFSNGGRPVPRVDVILLSVKHAITQTLAPMRRPPFLGDFPGGPLLAGLLAVAAAGIWIHYCARDWNKDGERGAEKRLALFGGAWWLFAYGPNFLWYISPRHNYLPSVGTAFLAAALALRIRRPTVAIAGGILFALGGLCAWSDGSAWAASTALHDRFREDALRQLPSNANAIFIVGAPKELRTAPAFSQPREHLHVLSRATGRLAPAGDNAIAANRLGLFFGTQTELFGPVAEPYFVAAASATVFAQRGDGRFERVCRLELTTPGLARREVAAGDCPGRLGVEVPVALVSSRAERSAAPIPETPVLQAASVAEGPGGTFDLTVTWLAGRAPAADFAANAVLLSASGAPVFRASYAASVHEHEIAWPLFDDAIPPSHWKPGTRVIETYRLRRTKAWAQAPATVRLTPYLRSGPSVWKTLPAQDATLKPS